MTPIDDPASPSAAARPVDLGLFRPLRAVPGYMAVVDVIRREVSLGRLLPGDRLPPERRLSEQLGVARETLRQALKVLEGSGLVTIERGAVGGAVIRSSHVNDALMIAELESRKDELFALLEYRSEIESSAARLAAERRMPQHLEQMHRAQAELASAQDKDQSRSADTAFHLAVATAAGNPFMHQAVEDARAGMFFPVDLARFVFVKDTSRRAHQAVLEAIENRDPRAASEAMRAHVGHTRVEIAELLTRGTVTGTPLR